MVEIAQRERFATKISRLERIGQSVNGNPRYKVWFENGRSGKTASDHSFVYGIENKELKGWVTVEMNARGIITDIRKARHIVDITEKDAEMLRSTQTEKESLTILADGITIEE